MPCAFLDPDGSHQCQFVVPEGELVKFFDQAWCRFHLPLKAGMAGQIRSPKADWTQEQIEAFNEEIFARIDEAKKGGGTADLLGVVFPGDISFARYKGEANSLPKIVFRQASFGGDAIFSGASFGGDVMFDEASFSGEAWFARTSFRRHVRFSRASFSSLARFNRASFGGGANFNRVSFGRNADFGEVSFSDDGADFGEVSFGGKAEFAGATFGGNAWFGEASFGGKAEFAGGTFGGAARFEKASFGADAWFEKAIFSSKTGFDEARFSGEAGFGRASFGGKAGFAGASFSGNACFEKASFSGNAWFDEASFGGNAWFEEASFGGHADFSCTGENAQDSATTFHWINFARATFGGPTRFHNRTFLSTTDFRGALFKCAPEFHGCTLHQNTIFPPQRDFRDWGGADAARAYRTLKHAMASVHARDEEAKFYALEQKSLLRNKDTPLSTKIFSALYWLASDYGQSVLRPLVGLLATFAAFFALYVAVLVIHLDPISNFVFPPIHAEDVLRFSLQQVFQPFEVFRVRPVATAEAAPEVLRVVPLPLAFLAALHSVLTLSFLALFLLALRRRYALRSTSAPARARRAALIPDPRSLHLRGCAGRRANPRAPASAATGWASP